MDRFADADVLSLSGRLDIVYYMMLIYTQERGPDALSPAERLRVEESHRALIDETRSRGILVAVNPLARTDAAATVRRSDDKVLVTDGPFAETKEQFAGYYILDCRDRDEAVAWAARIPTQCGGAHGSIEIRRVHEIPGVPESRLSPGPH